MKPLPDPYPIEPLTKPPNCTITVPGSKSITNRALILAALSDNKCKLWGALWADDTQVMVDSLQRLGFRIKIQADPVEQCNRTIIIEGRGGRIPAEKAELYVGNAGTTARFLAAFVALGDGEYKISGDSRMNERPMADLFAGLRELGVKITPSDQLPVTIQSLGRLSLSKKRLVVSSRRSSQFASALLMIAPLGGFEVELMEADEPRGYTTMTKEMIAEFRRDYVIEPDMSSASYFVAAGWLTSGKVQIAGWPKSSLQIDSKFPQFLPPRATVSRHTDLGDSVMTLAICTLFGKREMKVVDAARLRLQETDRIKAMVTELQRVGAKAEEHEDGFRVWPAEPGQLHGADIETYNDHRMAMCFAVLGLKVPGIRIKNPGCVSKTFPNFFEKLEQLRQ